MSSSLAAIFPLVTRSECHVCASEDLALFAGNGWLRLTKTTNMFERDHCLLLISSLYIICDDKMM